MTCVFAMVMPSRKTTKCIDVLYDSDNRAHHLTLTMHLPIVTDGIKKLRSGREGRECEVTPGTDTVSLVSPKRRSRFVRHVYFFTDLMHSEYEPWAGDTL